MRGEDASARECRRIIETRCSPVELALGDLPVSSPAAIRRKREGRCELFRRGHVPERRNTTTEPLGHGGPSRGE